MKVWCESCKGSRLDKSTWHCSRNGVKSNPKCEDCQGKGYKEIKSIKFTKKQLSESMWIGHCPDEESKVNQNCFYKENPGTCLECWENALKEISCVEVADE